MNQITNIVAAAGVLYEMFARIIPTKKNWSIVHKVFSVLKAVSGFLNVEKKDDKPRFPTATPYLLCLLFATTVLFSCKTLRNTQVDCLSSKMVHITLIDAKGNPYTFHQKYCDTIRVVVLPDTTNLKK